MQAKAVMVSIGPQLLTLHELFESVRKLADDWVDNHWRGFGQFAAPDQSLGRFPVRDLVSLMGHFRRKQCSVPRDRVFSLLSLSRDSGRVDVDYECRAVDLAVQILSFHPWKLCVCSAAIVSASLELPENTLEAWLEIDVAGIRLVSNTIRDLNNWNEDAPYLYLEHPETSSTWAYENQSAYKSPLPKCLEDALGYFCTGILRDNTLVSRRTMPQYPMRVIPLSELLGRHTSKRTDWYSLRDESTFQIAVSDPERNLCTMRMPLQAVSHVVTSNTVELCCSHSKPWFQDGNDGVIRAIRISYNEQRVSCAITPPKPPTPISTNWIPNRWDTPSAQRTINDRLRVSYRSVESSETVHPNNTVIMPLGRALER
jgi:hypothetical protein